MRKQIIIKTPSRLHFALIDLTDSLNRIDGGIGLALQDPHFRIIAEASDQVKIDALNSDNKLTGANLTAIHRATELVERLKERYEFSGVKLRIEEGIPAHTGLGSGTQLSLGITKAICELYEIDLSTEEMALIAGRGGTSGIGVAAFENGGFILDGGHRYPEPKNSFLPSSESYNVPPPPVLLRDDFPDWPILIVIPECKQISGEEEVELFQTLCPMPKSTAEQISHLIIMKLLPALIKENIEEFGNGINRLQKIGWKKVELNVQGEIVKNAIKFLLDNGAYGVGLSSWGPALYAFCEDAETLCKRAQDYLDSHSGGHCFVTYANNKGAEIDY